ncbi:MAG: FAD-dependent oxidoreductase [Candidatus Omnitrophica bacterium]|nr:FAD-dependent oxidoreductase [Candidatus Omnitrophota bacterium]
MTVADSLSRSKIDTIILEKESEVGGLARTIDFKGFKFDIGGHALFIKNTKNDVYLKEIIEHNKLLTLKRRAKILFNNKYLDYPPNISSVIGMDKKYSFRIFFDMFKLRKDGHQDNFEKWIKANYGDCLYRIYFKDYTEKVWGVSCDNLSADWAGKRIGENSLFNSFCSLFKCNVYCKENRRSFYYFKDGIGLVSRVLKERVEKNKCKIYRNVSIGRFSTDNGKICSLRFTCEGSDYEIFFKKVISTIPIVELVNLFPPGNKETLKNVTEKIKYRSLILVNLILSQPIATEWYWSYFPSNEVIFSRIHEPKYWSRDMVIDQDKTMLSAEVFCDYDDSYWTMKDSEIISQTKRGLLSIGLVDERNFGDAIVYRVKYAYPLYYVGFKEPLNDAKSLFNKFNNLYLTGRNGTHSYFDMEDCIENSRTMISSLCGK